jgi:acetylornithine deacetylase
MMTDMPATETLAILTDLIGFDTVSARSNLDMIDHVAEYLRAYDVPADVIPSPDGRKASLWATVGPLVDGGLVLSGHSDVVPVEGQNWSSDPFQLTNRDGRVFGRGAADMKGFIACVLAAVPDFMALPLQRPIHIALTYDEEVGCQGAPKLLEWLEHQQPRPSMAIIGEPTSMNVVSAHKGILVARTEITGVEAHSSLAHLGISAISLAARAMGLLEMIEREVAAERQDAKFEPARTTMSVNRIAGGTAVNILAGHAWFEWDIRTVPGVDAHAILETFASRFEDGVIRPLRDKFPTIAVNTEIIADAPALAPEADGLAETLAMRLLGTNETCAVAFAAEAGQFQRAGLSTVIVGPGSIEQAHKADEYVELDQLARCDAFLRRLGSALAARRCA